MKEVNTMKFLKNKKGVSSVVAILLVMVVAVAVVFSLNKWVIGFINTTDEEKIEQPTKDLLSNIRKDSIKNILLEQAQEIYYDKEVENIEFTIYDDKSEAEETYCEYIVYFKDNSTAKLKAKFRSDFSIVFNEETIPKNSSDR